MNDMSAVIIPKSDQINADDLIAGPRTIRIAGVAIRGGEEQPVSIAIEGEKKVFRPCKSMSRVMVAAWGPDSSSYVGRSLTLYRDDKVKWGGMEVGGIRIGAMSHIERPLTLALTATKGSRKPHTVEPLVAAVVAHKAPAVPDEEAREQAAGWVARTLKVIASAPDRIALAEVQTKRAPTLATTRALFPDLAEQVDAAIALKLAAFDEGGGE